MGAAIASFPGAGLLQVPRTRFVPVKTTDDLLLLRSDAYRLGDEFRVELVPIRPARTAISRSWRSTSAYFGMIDDFEARMPAGPPSLREAERFVVNGDVSFGAGVVVRGDVEIDAPPEGLRIDDGTVLDGLRSDARRRDRAQVAGGRRAGRSARGTVGADRAGLSDDRIETGPRRVCGVAASAAS